jgi:hypothetical protein
MRRLTLSLLLFTSVFLSTMAPMTVAAPLPDFEASYKLEQHNLRIGTVSIALHTDKQGHYRYEFRSQPTGWISWLLNNQLHESSRGETTDSGIRPDKYHYRRSGGRKREADLLFDWESMTVENHVADSHWEMDIPAGTLDKLATQLGIMIALDQGKQDVTFNVADGGTLKEYRYRVIGKETLDVPAGTFKTIKVAKLRKDIDQETIIWFAPALHYLPVRIWRRDSDDEEYLSDLEELSRSLWGKKNK